MAQKQTMKLHMRWALVRIVGAILLLSLTATTCGSSHAVDVECFDIDGEAVCGETVDYSRVSFGIELEDAGDFVVRIHPEDAERWDLPEETFLELNERTGRSMAIIERTMRGLQAVRLSHNVYLVDLANEQQTVLFPARDTRQSLTRSWSPGNSEFEPIPEASQ